MSVCDAYTYGLKHMYSFLVVLFPKFRCFWPKYLYSSSCTNLWSSLYYVRNSQNLISNYTKITFFFLLDLRIIWLAFKVLSVSLLEISSFAGRGLYFITFVCYHSSLIASYIIAMILYIDDLYDTLVLLEHVYLCFVAVL